MADRLLWLLVGAGLYAAAEELLWRLVEAIDPDHDYPLLIEDRADARELVQR